MPNNKKKIDLRSMGLSDLMKFHNKRTQQASAGRARMQTKRKNFSNLRVMNKELQDIRDKFFNQTPIFELNNMLWPWQSSTALVEVLPDNTGISKISITAEASFIVTSIQAVVFDTTGATPVYVNPESLLADGLTDGLKVTINDLSSERSFMERPVSIENMGNYVNPLIYTDPFYLDPNQSLEVKFTNQSQTKTYVPQLLFKGYRLRVEDANSMIQKVTL